MLNIFWKFAFNVVVYCQWKYTEEGSTSGSCRVKFVKYELQKHWSWPQSATEISLQEW